MENLAFHSLFRWKMIILPILTTSLVCFCLWIVWENVPFELWNERGIQLRDTKTTLIQEWSPTSHNATHFQVTPNCKLHKRARIQRMSLPSHSFSTMNLYRVLCLDPSTISYWVNIPSTQYKRPQPIIHEHHWIPRIDSTNHMRTYIGSYSYSWVTCVLPSNHMRGFSGHVCGLYSPFVLGQRHGHVASLVLDSEVEHVVAHGVGAHLLLPDRQQELHDVGVATNRGQV